MEINENIYDKLINKDKIEILKVINFLIKNKDEKELGITFNGLDSIKEQAIISFLKKLRKNIKDAEMEIEEVIIDDKIIDKKYITKFGESIDN